MKGDNVAALSPQNNQKVINSYTYDNYRLKTISHNGFNYSFAYDNFGNVTQTKVGSQVLSTNTYGDSNWKDKLTAFNGREITYDEIGNPLTYKGFNLTWQNGRQLASMRFGTVNIGFTYDVDGLRTSKTVHNVDLEHKYY